MYIRIICVAVGLCIPLFIERIKGQTFSDYFKFKTLSKIVSILLVYYGFGILYNAIKPEGSSFLLSSFMSVLLTTVFVVAVAKHSPLKNDMKKLAAFPNFDLRSKYYIVMLIFFSFVSFSTYLTVNFYPQKIQQQFRNFVIMKAFYETPYASIIVLILTGIFAIVGEELVFRYYAINTLRQKLDKSSVVFISSLMWTLMHWDTSFVTFLLGLLLGYLYYETGSLLLCIVLHAVFNFIVLTEPFYMFYKEKGLLTNSSYHYVAALFIVQLLLYHLAKIVFVKSRLCCETK